MSIFRENPEYLEDIIDEMVSKKNLLKQAFKNSFINKLGELTTDIEEKLAEDYGDENGNFDIENWDTSNDGEVIAYDIGYRNACLNAVKIINKLTEEQK